MRSALTRPCCCRLPVLPPAEKARGAPAAAASTAAAATATAPWCPAAGMGCICMQQDKRELLSEGTRLWLCWQKKVAYGLGRRPAKDNIPTAVRHEPIAWKAKEQRVVLPTCGTAFCLTSAAAPLLAHARPNSHLCPHPRLSSRCGKLEGALYIVKHSARIAGTLSHALSANPTLLFKALLQLSSILEEIIQHLSQCGADNRAHWSVHNIIIPAVSCQCMFEHACENK